MAAQFFHRVLSQMFGNKRWAIWAMFTFGWFVFDGDTWARSIFWGLVAEVANVFLVSVLVFFATYPIFIPVALILIIFLFLLSYDLADWFRTDWSKIISAYPDIVTITEKKTKKTIYCVAIQNHGFIDVKDCFVEVEDVYWFPVDGKGFHGESEGMMNFKGKLGWVENALQSRDCKRDIEGKNQGTLVKLVEFEFNKPVIIRLCDDKYSSFKGIYGTMFALIRIGGVVNGFSIRPVYTRVSVSQSRPVKSKSAIQVAGTGVRKLKNREEFYAEKSWYDKYYKEEKKKKA